MRDSSRLVALERRPLGLFPGPDPGSPLRDLTPKREDLRPLLDASPAVVEHLRAQPGIVDYLDAQGHTNRTRSVTSLAFTRDGHHLLVGSASPDSRWLILTDRAADQNSIAIFDTSDWRLVRELRFSSTEEAVSGASVDPTGRFLATGGDDDSIRIWELPTGRLVGQCNGQARFADPVWSPNGRTLATDDGAIRLWSATVFRELATVDTSGDFIPLGFTADTRSLVSISLSGLVNIITPPTLAEIDGAP